MRLDTATHDRSCSGSVRPCAVSLWAAHRSSEIIWHLAEGLQHDSVFKLTKLSVATPREGHCADIDRIAGHCMCSSDCSICVGTFNGLSGCEPAIDRCERQCDVVDQRRLQRRVTSRLEQKENNGQEGYLEASSCRASGGASRAFCFAWRPHGPRRFGVVPI